ncbi:ATP-binding protein [Marinilabiliaceae bacterium ANBcel2]|nr:ATP-binding protein [Marinilabiliaceae bacterium ANBcel2]
MSYKIAVVSGKGGTGKTTVSLSLFHYFQKRLGASVHLVDCDVEEPNDALFFTNKKLIKTLPIHQEAPEIDNSLCTFCKKCSNTCAFNAITVIPAVKYTKTDYSLCHSCGACKIICNENAIQLQKKIIGTINHYNISGNGYLSEGVLNIGSAMQTMLIKALKHNIPQKNDIIIYDSRPGTSCAATQTLLNIDMAIVVAEPTPFGVHDMKLTLNLINELKIDYGIIINKSGLGNNEIYKVIRDYKAETYGSIPFNKEYASAYASSGFLKGETPGSIETCYNEIIDNINKKMLVHEGSNHT